uniref:Putative 3' terminal rna ribose 2'-o-methyltransferase hen1 n=1 Tax=Ixodes ricinus TaxID=34613 RepID=A0A0K8RDG2_IXORI
MAIWLQWPIPGNSPDGASPTPVYSTEYPGVCIQNAATQLWNSALLHSNLWSQCLIGPEGFRGKPTLEVPVGVVITATVGTDKTEESVPGRFVQVHPWVRSVLTKLDC